MKYTDSWKKLRQQQDTAYYYGNSIKKRFKNLEKSINDVKGKQGQRKTKLRAMFYADVCLWQILRQVLLERWTHLMFKAHSKSRKDRHEKLVPILGYC